MPGKSKTPAVTEEKIVIKSPNIQSATFKIVGTSPYVQHRFTTKALLEMHEGQRQGAAASNKKKREPKDFEAEFRDAQHVSTEGWWGIPATAMKRALVSACSLCGIYMTRAKKILRVEADGIDQNDGTPLIRITKGEPQPLEVPVRIANGRCDLRTRPMWLPGWEALVTIRYDADQLTKSDLANLMVRAGLQVGIGEGRADSPNSCGQDWGYFRVFDGEEDK